MPKDHGRRDRVSHEGGEDTRREDSKKSAVKDIDWSKWWPFDRATGDAYDQLNRRQRKRSELEEIGRAHV